MSVISYHIVTLSDTCDIILTLGVEMTDGPFKNAALSSRWKQYGKDLVSDAATSEERTAQACHSILGDKDMKGLGPLLSALKAHAQRPQMDLDPVSSAEAIFDSYAKSPLTDILQKHVTANLRDQIPGERALAQALRSAVTDRIAITKNRMDEECIRARDVGDMSHENYRKGIERNHETFNAIRPNELCEALVSGNGRAFKQATRKKVGVDEGPNE